MQKIWCSVTATYKDVIVHPSVEVHAHSKLYKNVEAHANCTEEQHTHIQLRVLWDKTTPNYIKIGYSEIMLYISRYSEIQLYTISEILFYISREIQFYINSEILLYKK